jgi:hypothetical protein
MGPSVKKIFAERRARHNYTHDASAGRDPRHNRVHRRRRSERRHIWAAVHCADGSAVGPSAQMRPVPRAAAQLSAKPLTRVYLG